MCEYLYQLICNYNNKPFREETSKKRNNLSLDPGHLFKLLTESNEKMLATINRARYNYLQNIRHNI